MTPAIYLAICLSAAAAETELVRPGDSAATVAMTAQDALVPSLPGIANARRRVTLSAPTEGVLFELLCEEGQTVAKGDVLAVIDNRIASAAAKLAFAEAEQTAGVVRAESDLRAAESLLARMTQAGERRAASELEIERARSSVEQAAAAVRQAQEQRTAAQAAYALEQAKLESLNIRAPFAGRVVRVRSVVGETLTLTKPVVELVDTSQLRVELYLPMQCYSRLEPSVEYRLLAGTPVHAAVKARLVLKDHDIDTGTETFRCVFEIDNLDDTLPSGFTARLRENAPDTSVSSSSMDRP